MLSTVHQSRDNHDDGGLSDPHFLGLPNMFAQIRYYIISFKASVSLGFRWSSILPNIIWLRSFEIYFGFKVYFDLNIRKRETKYVVLYHKYKRSLNNKLLLILKLLKFLYAVNTVIKNSVYCRFFPNSLFYSTVIWFDTRILRTIHRIFYLFEMVW